MHRSYCPINGYIRLRFPLSIRAELTSIGDDSLSQFTGSCFGHLLREGWGGFVSNAALHALFTREIVRVDARDDEFWFMIGHKPIRFSRLEYALVTGLRFGDSHFDVHGDVTPPVGSVFDRYPEVRDGRPLDSIRDLFIGGHFRAQSGDALKVAKVLCAYYLIFGVDGGKYIADPWMWTLVEDTETWESFPWGLYSYQILCTYIREVPIELPSTDRGYHFYGNIYAIMVRFYTVI